MLLDSNVTVRREWWMDKKTDGQVPPPPSILSEIHAIKHSILGPKLSVVVCLVTYTVFLLYFFRRWGRGQTPPILWKN